MIAERATGNARDRCRGFFVDAYETSLQADELLTEIRLPTPGANSRSAYLKFGYLERPSVGVAVALTLDGAIVNDVKIAVGLRRSRAKRGCRSRNLTQ